MLDSPGKAEENQNVVSTWLLLFTYADVSRKALWGRPSCKGHVWY